MKQSTHRKISNRTTLNEMARAVGCTLSSIGDVERLAGIHTERERHDLWFQFRFLFKAPSQVLIDAVMDHCAAIAVRRIEAGEIFLIPTHRSFIPTCQRMTP